VQQFNIDSGVLPEEVTSEFDSSFTDTSSALFSQYLSHADKHDTEQAESWKASADGTLVFVCNRFFLACHPLAVCEQDTDQHVRYCPHC
jgi:hypothetical protein